jgi:Spy/CpxP family protein refolding chaperone
MYWYFRRLIVSVSLTGGQVRRPKRHPDGTISGGLMRRIALISGIALAIAACSSDTTAPATTDITIDPTAFGTALTVAGGYDADLYQNRLLNALPDSLKLSADQQTKIKALVEAFDAATRTDRDSLTTLLGKARDAARSRASADSVGKILARGLEITARLAAAQAKLKSDIDAVLTPDQRAWIAAHAPASCRPGSFTPLTDAQKAQITTLEQAFQANNKADLQAVRAAFDSAQGKTKAERDVILASVAPAIARLDAARKALTASIVAVLTPEQKASGCLPLG